MGSLPLCHVLYKGTGTSGAGKSNPETTQIWAGCSPVRSEKEELVLYYSKQKSNKIKGEEEPKLVSVNETWKEPLDLYQKTWKGTYIAKESPSPENRDLQHASSESVLLQREVTRFSTHYKNVKLKSQANSLKSRRGNRRPFASHGKVKSQHCSPPPPKNKRQRAPSPRKRKHSLQLCSIKSKHTV